MPYDSAAKEPVENTPVPATLTLPDGRVIPMPAALSAEQVEALAYVATLFLGPPEAAAGASYADRAHFNEVSRVSCIDGTPLEPQRDI